MTAEEELNEKHSIHSVVDEAIRGALQAGYVKSSNESSIEIKNLKDANIKIMEKLDKFGDKLEKLEIDIAKLPEMLAKEFDNRYASKMSERVIYGMAGAVLLGVVYALLEVVIK